MFALWFVIGLISCVPARLSYVVLFPDLSNGWPIMSGISLALMTLLVTLNQRSLGRKDSWFGLIFGAFVGSCAIWFLEVYGR
jgi:drug/metabolite transporter superfamily protein YnfA